MIKKVLKEQIYDEDIFRGYFGFDDDLKTYIKDQPTE